MESSWSALRNPFGEGKEVICPSDAFKRFIGRSKKHITVLSGTKLQTKKGDVPVKHVSRCHS